MGFLIRDIKTRDGEGTVILKGNDDGTVEFCRPSMQVDSKTGETVEVMVGYKFFALLDNALDRLFRMRVCNRDATTLQELLVNVKQERELLQKEFEGIIPVRRRR